MKHPSHCWTGKNRGSLWLVSIVLYRSLHFPFHSCIIHTSPIKGFANSYCKIFQIVRMNNCVSLIKSENLLKSSHLYSLLQNNSSIAQLFTEYHRLREILSAFRNLELVNDYWISSATNVSKFLSVFLINFIATFGTEYFQTIYSNLCDR